MRLPLLLLIAGCSDYKFVPEEGTPDPQPEEEGLEGTPSIVADPPAVDAGVVCGAHAQDLLITNAGDATLTVTSAGVVGDGWTLEAEPTPWSLPPGVSVPVTVTGVGVADLQIESDDPNTPLLSVPLSGAADQPPTLTWLSPADGAVIPVGGAVDFSVLIADDADAPADLTARWSSDVEGVLAEGPPGADGVSTLPWVSGAHASGTHRVGVEVTDSCGHAVSSDVGVCQDEGYVEAELDLASWYFAGSALWDSGNGWVEVTGPLLDQAGTAFQISETVMADSVEIRFSFYQGGGTGADGLALTALDTTRMTTYVGATGGGIGYMGLPGWSIEVDTYCNGEWDPTCDDHVSMHFDGNLYAIAAWATLPEMEDTGWHEMKVTVAAPHVTVQIDGVTYIDADIPGYYAFPAYIGFSAATGSLTNYHLIDALEVERFVCDGG